MGEMVSFVVGAVVGGLSAVVLLDDMVRRTSDKCDATLKAAKECLEASRRYADIRPPYS